MSEFVICINNDSNPASLILGKVSRRLPDAEAKAHNMLRIMDEDRQSLTAISTRRPCLHRSSCRKWQSGCSWQQATDPKQRLVRREPT